MTAKIQLKTHAQW